MPWDGLTVSLALLARRRHRSRVSGAIEMRMGNGMRSAGDRTGRTVWLACGDRGIPCKRTHRQ